MRSAQPAKGQDHFDLSAVAFRNLRVSAERVRGLETDAVTTVSQALTRNVVTTEFRRHWYVAVVSLFHQAGSFDDLQECLEESVREFESDPLMRLVVGAAWETLAADLTEVTGFHEMSFRGPNAKLPENLIRRHVAEVRGKARSHAMDSLTQSLSFSDEAQQSADPR